MLKCVEILREPFQIQPDAPIVQVDPEEAGLTPATDPDNVPDDSGIDMAGPTDKFDKSLELVYRALEKKGYKKEEAEKIMAVLFDPNDPFPEAREKLTNDSSEQENLMAHKAYKHNLGSLLFEEKLPYEEFEKFMKNGAKAAKVTEPNDEQIANAAVAFNLANGIGDITDLPKKAEKAEVNAELEDMKKKVSGLEEKLDDATEVKKKWMQQLVKQKTITKEQAKEIERLAGREATLEKVVESLQELAHRDGLQIRELEAAEAALQQQITAQQEEWSKKEEEMVNEISNLTAQIEAAKDSMDKAETLDILQLIVDENMKDLLDFVEQIIGQINDKHAAELTKALEEKETELQAKLAEFESGSTKARSISNVYNFVNSFMQHMKSAGIDPKVVTKDDSPYNKNYAELEDPYRKKVDNLYKKYQADNEDKVTSLLKGKIDFNDDSKKESVRTTKTQDQLIMERWQKLAGLL
jgi:chromosome segregation ATPase